jgi:hypothetical protein
VPTTYEKIPKHPAAIITRTDGETVTTIGQIPRVASADNGKCAEHHEKPSESKIISLKNGNANGKRMAHARCWQSRNIQQRQSAPRRRRYCRNNVVVAW